MSVQVDVCTENNMTAQVFLILSLTRPVLPEDTTPYSDGYLHANYTVSHVILPHSLKIQRNFFAWTSFSFSSSSSFPLLPPLPQPLLRQQILLSSAACFIFFVATAAGGQIIF